MPAYRVRAVVKVHQGMGPMAKEDLTLTVIADDTTTVEDQVESYVRNQELHFDKIKSIKHVSNIVLKSGEEVE